MTNMKGVRTEGSEWKVVVVELDEGKTRNAFELLGKAR
jgi:hypothetical protein